MSNFFRSLGKNGPMVPRVGFGHMGMSTHASYGPSPSDEERLALLDHALEIGETFWDTSDLYGDGEELVGKWLKRTGKRDQIFLASKFGYVKGSKSREIDSSYTYTKKACEESLKALETDHIDLYYMHNANSDTPIEETMRALAELQAEGKIKHIGLSTISSKTLLRAAKIAPIAAVQMPYSILTRAIEGPTGTNLLSTARSLGIATVVAMPFDRGLITNTFASPSSLHPADTRPMASPRFSTDNLPHNVELVGQLKRFADKKGCSVAQLALAWLLKQGDDIFPIPGTKRVEYLDENWAAMGIELSDGEEREIREWAEGVEVAGHVVPPAFLSYVFRDTREE